MSAVPSFVCLTCRARPRKSRGCCRTCYRRYREAVAAGRVTWRELEARGMARAPTLPGQKWRRWFGLPPRTLPGGPGRGSERA
jgi:hypothetical protein